MFVEDFKAEALEKVDELKEAWIDLTEKWEAELKKLYDQRSQYLEKAGNLGKQALAGAQKKLDDVLDEVQGKSTKKVTKKKTPTKKKPTKTVAKKKTTQKKKTS